MKKALIEPMERWEAAFASALLCLEELDVLRKSWHDLCRLISRLDKETDWSGCDDNTFDEQFDPWVILRTLAHSPEDDPARSPMRWRSSLPSRYRPSLRLDGLYEIFMYPDDPAYQAALQHLTKRTFSALSAGYSFVGRPEDYARFEAALAHSPEDAHHERE